MSILSHMTTRTAGFTLIELMIVIAIIAIVASAAVPHLLSSRIAANETSAISTMRNLATSQAEFMTSKAIDVDTDGAGEFGTFGEMSGATLLNARGVGPGAVLNPPILSSKFQAIDGQGRARKSGYLFLIFLPNAAAAGVAEVAGGGPGAGLDANNCEMYWCCYAWPVQDGTTGKRAFFVNHSGEILQTSMDATAYDQNQNPAWDAALIGVNGNMGDPAAVAGVNAQDGNVWRPVQ